MERPLDFQATRIPFGALCREYFRSFAVVAIATNP